ncbi:MAG: hypothetical protein HC896_13350, partial [Bacteroidales bacterium]|nr:hypothetical protein [Bacteroidales bacterium]
DQANSTARCTGTALQNFVEASAATLAYKMARGMDFNADGEPDGTYTDAAGLTWRYYFKKANNRNRLRKITDGLGNQTLITYKPISAATVHTPATTNKFVGPLYVVSQVQQSNGLGGLFATLYTYQGATRFKPLNSLLGFKKHVCNLGRKPNNRADR